MRDLLILSLLAFASMSAKLNCEGLHGVLTFNDVSHCSKLKASKETPTELGLKSVDGEKWEKWAARLRTVVNVDIVIDGSSITQIHLPNITTFRKSQLIVKNNALLQSIDIITRHCQMTDLIISDNPKLTVFKLAAKKNFDVEEKIEFVNNKMLKIANIPKLTKEAAKKGLTVEGNPRLEKGSLQIFNELKSDLSSPSLKSPVYVQKEGECIFKKTIEDLGELVGCKYVKGDLTLAKDVKGDGKETKLTEVTGTVDLGNLPQDKAGFLEGTKLTKGEKAIKSDKCIELKTEPKPKYSNQDDCDKEIAMSIWIIIGIAAGVLLLVLIIVGVLVYCLCCRKKKGGGGKGKGKK